MVPFIVYTCLQSYLGSKIAFENSTFPIGGQSCFWTRSNIGFVKNVLVIFFIFLFPTRVIERCLSMIQYCNVVHAITRMYEHFESYLVKCKALSKPGTLFIYFLKPSSSLQLCGKVARYLRSLRNLKLSISKEFLLWLSLVIATFSYKKLLLSLTRK